MAETGRWPMYVKLGYRTWIITSSLVLGNEVDGRTDIEDGRILIRPGRPADYTAEVVIHELSHAVWSHFDLQDNDEEEKVVTAMGKGWAELLARNPHLVAFLQEALK